MKALLSILIGVAMFSGFSGLARAGTGPDSARAGVGARLPAGSAWIAVNRCGPQNLNDFATTVRDDEAHPPRGGADQQVKRFDALQQLIAELGEERGVLEAVCPASVNRDRFNNAIAAAQALAMVLESDIAVRLGAPCASAQGAVQRQFLAGAWYTLSHQITDVGGTIDPGIAQVAAKVRSRAATAALTLPSYADTSAYWRDGVKAATKKSLQACATPAPSPPSSTEESPVPAGLPSATPSPER